MPRKITYEQQAQMGLVPPRPKRGHRSAADLGLPTEQPRQASITRIEPAPPAAPVQFGLPSNDVAYRAGKGEHLDIARAFRTVALPVSISAAFALPITAWAGLGMPIISVFSLALMVSTFTVAYFGCWILSQFFSHYGVEIAKVLAGYWLLRHDQKERHRYYRQQVK